MKVLILLSALILAAGCAQIESPRHKADDPWSMPLGQGLGSLPCLTPARSRSICAENPTGGKGQGGMAIPNPADPFPAASARAADELGQGWKVRPFLRVNKGQTATLMDVDGPGVIQHIWMVEGLSRALVRVK